MNNHCAPPKEQQPNHCPPAVNPADPDTIPKFVDPLPIPLTLHPTRKEADQDYYEVRMMAARHRFHRLFPKTYVWGYEGLYPGPTIATMRDRKVAIRWINELPSKHFLPLDRTLHGAKDSAEVRTVVHLHGADVGPRSDGHPEAWYTKDLQFTGPQFDGDTSEYTNNQQAATLWYHDHAIGITRLNVYAGLAGFYLIRDTLEPRLKLPQGPYEIPLLIQDKTFHPDGSLFYPSEPPFPTPVRPSVVPAFNGNTIVVNGKLWPHLKVEPRKYRFRLLNGSNSRSYVFFLSQEGIAQQIGTDGGLMSRPIPLKQLPLAPAERADLIIDFSKHQGETIRLLNDIQSPHLSQIMEFQVCLPLKGKDESQVPADLYPVEPIMPHLAARSRFLTLSGETDRYGRPMLMLDHRMWHDPATEKPEVDTIEVWHFLNLTAFPHPMHLHLVQFQILDRRPFDVAHYNETGKIHYTAPPKPPLPCELGWKDVVMSTAGEVTRIIAHFRSEGNYVWHCHILEHEDHDMMRPLVVVPCGCGQDPMPPHHVEINPAPPVHHHFTEACPEEPEEPEESTEPKDAIKWAEETDRGTLLLKLLLALLS